MKSIQNVVGLAILVAGLVIGISLASLWRGSGNATTAAAASDDTLTKVKRTGEIHVGYIEFPPTIMKDPNSGEVTGHFADSVEYIAKEIDAKVVWHETNWDTFVAGLQAGNFDLTAAATYVTIPRAKAVVFTHPLMYLGNSIIVRTGESRFRDPMDLNQSNLTIACTQGTGEAAWAADKLPKAKLIVLPGPNLQMPLLEVLSGRADAALTDTHTARKFIEKHDKAEALFAGKPLNLTAVAWTVRYGDDKWLHFLNSSLQYLELSGRLQEMEEKYDANWLHTTVEFR